jgi:PAS domain S-box-containing protein
MKKSEHKKRNFDVDIDKLRSALLERERNNDSSNPEITYDRFEKIINELSVYQTELEQQNEELLQTQSELDRQRQRYSSLYNLAPVGYLTLDKSGVIMGVNLTAARLLGVEPNRAINRKFISLLEPEDHRRFFDYIHSLSQDETREFETRVRSAGKEDRIFKLEGALFHDRFDDQTEYRVVVSDVTDNKRAEAELRRFRRTLDLTNEAVFIFSQGGDSFTYANLGAAALFECDRETILSADPAVLAPDGDERTFAKTIDRLVESESKYLSYESRIKTKTGKSIFIEALVQFIEDDEEGRFVVLARNVSERKETERQLREARRKAEESSRLKSSLLMNLSHEIRTPINGVLGLTRALHDRIEEPALKGLAAKVLHSSRRLTNTLHSLLEYSQLRSGETPMKLEPTSLRDIAERVVENARAKADAPDVRVSLVAPEDVYCDLDRDFILQILGNILDNAIKFTPKGKAEVRVERRRDGQGEWGVVVVRDTGIGVSKDKLRTIFEEFRQESEGIRRRYEGSGLGLTLAKQMTELMNGVVELSSVEGEGTTVVVKFPVVESARSDAPKRSTRDGERFRALVVEDNQLNVEVTKLYIEEYADVDFALTGEEAIEKAQANQYDVYLVDINLGSGIDGVETMTRIRALENYNDAPFVAVTGYALAAERKLLVGDSFDDFIPKPFEKESLENTLKRLGFIDSTD